jgi:hypothetical protein
MDLINESGTLVFDGVDYGGGKQLGAGIYTGPYPGAWPVIKGKGYESYLFDCRVDLILFQGLRHLHRY